MCFQIIVCLVIVSATMTAGVVVSDARASPSLDQCQIVENFVNKVSSQAVEIAKCKEELQELQNSDKKYQRLYSVYKTLKTQQESLSSILFFSPLVYKNKRYYVSKVAYQNQTDASSYCAAIGGYLAEIDDDAEYRALQGLVMGLPVDLVVIAGTDAAVEGTWIYPRTGKSVPILDWCPNQPDNLGNEDCLNLWKSYGAKMNDLPCGFRNEADRFMCETPVLDSP